VTASWRTRSGALHALDNYTQKSRFPEQLGPLRASGEEMQVPPGTGRPREVPCPGGAPPELNSGPGFSFQGRVSRRPSEQRGRVIVQDRSNFYADGASRFQRRYHPTGIAGRVGFAAVRAAPSSLTPNPSCWAPRRRTMKESCHICHAQRLLEHIKPPDDWPWQTHGRCRPRLQTTQCTLQNETGTERLLHSGTTTYPSLTIS
jgi:hypothetical protein